MTAMTRKFDLTWRAQRVRIALGAPFPVKEVRRLTSMAVMGQLRAGR
jgi:hypothetical protein